MKSVPELKPQYVVTTEGEKVAVVLSIDEYVSLLEDLSDLAILAERREEPSIPHEQVIADLKINGYL